MYVTGGVEDGNRVVTTLRCYDPATDKWEFKAPMQTGQYVILRGPLMRIKDKRTIRF